MAQIVGNLPTALWICISSYFSTLEEFLQLSEVCRDWHLYFHKSSSEVWLTLAKIHKLDYHIAVHSKFSLRNKTDYKRIFLKSYYEKLRKLREAHQVLLMKCREFFNKSKQDSVTWLEKCIVKEVSLDDLQVNYSNEYMEYNTLLLLAARHGRVNCAKYIVDVLKANIDCQDVGGLTPLMVFAYRGDLSAVKWLIKKGAQITTLGRIRSGVPLTAEHIAATNRDHMGCREVFHFLRALRSSKNTSLKSPKSKAGFPLSPGGDPASTFHAASAVCICGREGCFTGMMVACDRAACIVEWYHLDCVGLSAVPEGAWECPDCLDLSFPEPSHILKHPPQHKSKSKPHHGLTSPTK